MVLNDFTEFPWIIPFVITLFLFGIVSKLGKVAGTFEHDTGNRIARETEEAFSTGVVKPRNLRSHLSVLLPILIIAAIFRFNSITIDPLDHLEQMYLNTAFHSRSIGELVMGDVPIQQSHQPGFPLILQLFRALKDDPVKIRYFSAFIGLVSIATTYILSILLFPESMYAATFIPLFVALSQLHIAYSRNITPYSLLYLLSTVSFILFIKLLKGKGKRLLPAFIAVGTATFYLHYYEIWILTIQCITAVTLLYGKNVSKTERIQVPGLLEGAAWIHLFMVPWYPCFVKGRIQSENTLFFERAIYQGGISITSALREILRIFSGLPEMGNPLWMVFLALMVAGIVFAYLSDKFRFRLILVPLLVSIGVDILFYFKFSSVTGGGYHFGVRHYIFALPFFAAAITQAGDTITRRYGTKQWKFFTLPISMFLLLGPSVITAFSYGFHSHEPDVRSAGDYITRQLKTDDAIIVMPAEFQSDIFAYYFKPTTNESFIDPKWRLYQNKLFFFPVRSVEFPAELALRHPLFKRVWLIHIDYDLFGVPVFSDIHERRITETLKKHFTLEGVRKFNKVKVKLYKRNSSIPGTFPVAFRGKTIFTDCKNHDLNRYFLTRQGFYNIEGNSAGFCTIIVPDSRKNSSGILEVAFDSAMNTPQRSSNILYRWDGTGSWESIPVPEKGGTVEFPIPSSLERKDLLHVFTMRSTKIINRNINPNAAETNPLGIKLFRIQRQ